MYTGTGTEADPYMVDTIADLYECAAIPGAYVCIADDISASSDDEYAAGTDQPLVIRCARLYGADDGRKVSGLAVGEGAKNLIKHDGEGTSEMELVSFVDCVFTRPLTETSQTTDLLFENMTIKDCDFSYAIRQASVLGANVLVGGDIETSSFYVMGTAVQDVSTGMTDSFIFHPDSAERCNFEAHGLHAFSGTVPLIANARKCLFLLEDTKLYHSSYNGPYIAADCYTCAFAISQQKMDSVPTKLDAGCSGMTGVNVIDAEFWTSIETDGFTLDDSIIKLSTAQMKSAAYLTEIGFLP